MKNMNLTAKRGLFLCVLCVLCVLCGKIASAAGVSTNKVMVIGTNNTLPPNETNFFVINSNLLNQSVSASGGGSGTLTNVAAVNTNGPAAGASVVVSGPTATVTLTNVPGLLTNNETNVTLAGAFSGDGAALTNLNASALASGTVPWAELPANDFVAATNGVESGTLAVTNYGGSGGGNVTPLNFNAGLHDDVLVNYNFGGPGTNSFKLVGLAGNWAGAFEVAPYYAFSFSNNGVFSAPSFSGNGAGLTNLNASALASGTVSPAYLPASNVYSGSASFSAGVTNTGANGVTNAGPLTNGGPIVFSGATAIISNQNEAILYVDTHSNLWAGGAGNFTMTGGSNVWPRLPGAGLQHHRRQKRRHRRASSTKQSDSLGQHRHWLASLASLFQWVGQHGHRPGCLGRLRQREWQYGRRRRRLGRHQRPERQHRGWFLRPGSQCHLQWHGYGL